MRLSNSEKMRQADAIAINEYRIPSTLLMTNAAEHIVKTALEFLPVNNSVCIFCGSGNNGGDGVAASYMLLKKGIEVQVYLVGSRDKMTADTLEMERRLKEYGGELQDFTHETAIPENCGLIIDAMYGIGLNSTLREKGLAAAELINSANIPVIAADIPSGVVADSGAVPGVAVKADVTVTFSMAKPGHFIEPGCAYCGEIRVCDIGIPDNVLAEAAIDVETIDCINLPFREKISHKYNYGRLVVLGGSVGYTGAINLCSRAAVRSGAGVVFLGVPENIYDICAIKNDEAVVTPLPCSEDGKFCGSSLMPAMDMLETATAAVIGPGLGRSEEMSDVVQSLLLNCWTPTVVDADAIYALGQDMSILEKINIPLILTPHEGEFKYLGGELTGDRIKDASDFAKKYGCVLVLKGHHTVAAFPDGESFICPYGNPGMAKGGCGDVLAGIMGAMLCQMPVKDAVKAALYIHAKTGDHCAEKFGEYFMTPSDMINCIWEITKQ